ncbi:type VII secretion AAA-ATPase EccA [Mycobacteroides abscessus]|uniref:type VII secretion AAA-ATPase EccA n=1 Tax=Mycobacteroides abscessus TaxID=36809 RepID=UPI00266CB487|nr:type VII secretion AAA-ATPase EccA [Mycobacteroides abscessus]MDO3331502.1 type VII secretion AAA-ATPase EccA [Mycobacteroides abscessus subsp. abscessus]
MTVAEHQQLASQYAAAVATNSADLRLQRFIDITELDDRACDAWVGRMSCGDMDSITVFRAWNSRHNFGSLASAADLAVANLNARVDIGCGYVHGFTIPVNTAKQLCIAYALDLATEGFFDDALEVLNEVPADGTGTWVRACVYSLGGRWDEVNKTVTGFKWAENPANKIYIPCADLLSGIAAAHMGLWTEAERQIVKANTVKPINEHFAHTVAWYMAMIYRETDREESALNQLEWLQAYHPGEKVTKALKEKGVRLEVTSREEIAARTDAWDAESAPEAADSEAAEREQALRDAQCVLDEIIGLANVKDQVSELWATAEMAAVRGQMGKRVSEKALHMIFAGPPGTKKTSIGEVVRDIFYGLGLIKERKLKYVLGKDLIAGHVGQTALKTDGVIDEALDGILFLDEAYSMVHGSKEAQVFGLQAIDTLLARMENEFDRLVVIVAGYPADLEKFLDANAGLRGRFTERVDFFGYNADEIVEIAHLIAALGDSVLEPEAANELWGTATFLANTNFNGRRALDAAGNGRFARSVVHKAEKVRDKRVNDFRKQQPAGTTLSDALVETVTVEDMRRAIEGVQNNVFSGQTPTEGQPSGIFLSPEQLAAAYAKLAEFGCQQPDIALYQALDAGGIQLAS